MQDRSSWGFGCFFQGDWRQGLWKDTNPFHNNYKPNRALLELYAIVMAVAVWAEKVAGKSIILRSDNTATVTFINRMRADIPAAMSLLSPLTKICLHFQIFLKAKHIQGTLNIESDWISRNQMAKFFSKHPQAPRQVPELPTYLWPPQWTREQMEKVPKNKALIGDNRSAEVTATRRDMARVREGDPLPESVANCEHIAIVQKHIARKVVQTLARDGHPGS